MGWRLWVLDVTTDLDIPTFVALAHSGDASRFCIGFGCHFDARLGVKRALTELNQLFDPERHQAAPWDVEAMADPQYLFPDNALPARVYADFAEVQHVDLRDDIATCVQRAQRANLEVLVLNQTRPDVGLAVAMVVVPGLRHFWPRFGPGRLYEVPVASRVVSAAAARTAAQSGSDLFIIRPSPSREGVREVYAQGDSRMHCAEGKQHAWPVHTARPLILSSRIQGACAGNVLGLPARGMPSQPEVIG